MIRFGPDAWFSGQVETRRAGERYFWDGLRRGGDPARPFVLLQYTLGGEGVFVDATGEHSQTPGRAFCAVIPDTHRYFLPETSPSWTFAWVILRHPYIVSRLCETARAAGAILDDAPDAALLVCLKTLIFESFPDRFAEEAALFDLLVAHDRCRDRSKPGVRPETSPGLGSRVRERVLHDLAEPHDVGSLAAALNLSRGHFTRRFLAETGESPGRFLLRLRLIEAARALAQTPDNLAEIAAKTGFTDANHLCRAFRRHYDVTPGTYRKQNGGAGR